MLILTSYVYIPLSFTISNHNFLIASRDGTLSVYSEFTLVWAAKLSSVPVQMAVADFGGQRGLVVTLDDTGRLSIGFMGTKPPLTAVPSLSGANTREVDYDRLDEEHRGLLQVRSPLFLSSNICNYYTMSGRYHLTQRLNKMLKILNNLQDNSGLSVREQGGAKGPGPTRDPVSSASHPRRGFLCREHPRSIS